MRRFVLLVSCVVVVDTSLYSVLTPLLPQYADRFDLSRTGAGVLLACYGAGVLLAALFGPFALVVSFRLHDAGWRSSEIAAVFLGAAALETVMNPLLGRLVDHRGHRMPIRAALVASIGFALALAWVSAPGLLAPLAVLGAVAFGALYSPGMAMISQSAEHAGLAQGIAFGVMNGAWAVGNMVGPAAAGAISQAAGDPAAWLVCAGLCTVTLAGLRLRIARATASG